MRLWEKVVDKTQQLQREVERLIKSGKMPSLEDVCRVVLETRKDFRLKILRARREEKLGGK
jgi:hypothetical protein